LVNSYVSTILKSFWIVSHISIKHWQQRKYGQQMQRLNQTVIATWGSKGEAWLADLPAITSSLARRWRLNGITPVEQMNYNYVALAIQADKTPVVMKISCDESLILSEYNALKHFNGHASIKVLDIEKNYHALLLEQAIPGTSLQKNYPRHVKNTIDIYAKVVKSLSTPTLSTKEFIHVSKWCDTIDRIDNHQIDQPLVDCARRLRSFLLISAEHEYICHGDLHLENIIQHGEKWLAIDPKGIIGEMAFEAAAFNLISQDDMREIHTVPNKMHDRILALSTALDLSYRRLLYWFFLRVIMSVQWFIEDNGDPGSMLALATLLYPLIEE
jgi:streptomycin 6-kinase